MAPLERFIRDSEGPRFLGHPALWAGTSYQADIPPSVGGSTKSSRPVSSVSSSPSALSGTPPSSVSSAPSLGGVRQPSLNEQLADMSLGQDNYVLPCILEDILGCPAKFSGREFTNWFEHSISHYMRLGPPRYARCIFCDDTFESSDAHTCWRKRMSHIARHFEMGTPIEHSRPDFYVINDMRNKGLLSKEDYDRCAGGCERPPVDGLRPHNWEPEEKRAKREADAEKANRILVSPSRQEKQRKAHSKIRESKSPVSKKPKSSVSIRHSF